LAFGYQFRSKYIGEGDDYKKGENRENIKGKKEKRMMKRKLKYKYKNSCHLRLGGERGKKILKIKFFLLKLR
jgi:hypothetical protein